MNHRRYTPAHLLLSALAGAFAALLAAALAAWAILGPQCLSLVTAWGLIRSRFVEELDLNALADAALSGMVSALDDRWSHYYSAQRHTQLQQQRENAYVGVGITVDYSDDRGLTILAVTPGGPAAQGGVVPGELITAVDGTSLRGNNTAGPSHSGGAGHHGHAGPFKPRRRPPQSGPDPGDHGGGAGVLGAAGGRRGLCPAGEFL